MSLFLTSLNDPRVVYSLALVSLILVAFIVSIVMAIHESCKASPADLMRRRMNERRLARHARYAR